MLQPLVERYDGLPAEQPAGLRDIRPALLRIVFTSLRQTGSMDLEAVEGATRAAVHRAGASVLAHLLDEQEPYALLVARRLRIP